MSGSNDLIGTILAAVVGVSSPAVIAVPSHVTAASLECQTEEMPWLQDARDLAEILAGPGGGKETEALLKALNDAGIRGGSGGSRAPATRTSTSTATPTPSGGSGGQGNRDGVGNGGGTDGAQDGGDEDSGTDSGDENSGDEESVDDASRVAPAAAEAQDVDWKELLGRLVMALNDASDPEARDLARSIAALNVSPVAVVVPAAAGDDEEESGDDESGDEDSDSGDEDGGDDADGEDADKSMSATPTPTRTATPTRTPAPTRSATATPSPRGTGNPTAGPGTDPNCDDTQGRDNADPTRTATPTPTTSPSASPSASATPNPGRNGNGDGNVPAGCTPNGGDSPSVSSANWRSIAQALATALAGNTDPQAVALANDLAKAGFAPGDGANPASATRPGAGNTTDLCGLIVAVVPLTTGDGQ